ncbi:MAG: hypothetical protein PF487_05840 [Bacteroidales bacterium]|jgi:hypothetical protein|nr:hypothetical protein [Bacteroidales bacterium]
MLTIWAKYCDNGENPPKEKMLLNVMTVAQRLQKQFPNKTPLTLYGDDNVIIDIDNDKQLDL